MNFDPNGYYANLTLKCLKSFEENSGSDYRPYAIAAMLLFIEEQKGLTEFLVNKEFKDYQDVLFMAYRVKEDLERVANSNNKRRVSERS